MATRPSREETASLVVQKILPQVDHLQIHLDGFDVVPEWAIADKISFSLHPNGSRLGAAGKLEVHEYGSEDDIILMVDDDVDIPKNLAFVIEQAVQRSQKSTLFGFHGSILNLDLTSYVIDREVINLSTPLKNPKLVDVVATCVAAYKWSDLEPKYKTWPIRNAVDLQLALDAKRQGIASVLLPRKKNWISFLDSFQPDSIFKRLVEDDSRQSILAQELLAIK